MKCRGKAEYYSGGESGEECEHQNADVDGYFGDAWEILGPNSAEKSNGCGGDNDSRGSARSRR